MKKLDLKKRNAQRGRRSARVRAKISGTANRPRLSVFRSNAHIYAQVVDDTIGKVLVSAHDLKLDGPKSERAAKVGEDIAKKALVASIKAVVFDRRSYKYHGRVKALADEVRKNGLEF